MSQTHTSWQYDCSDPSIAFHNIRKASDHKPSAQGMLHDSNFHCCLSNLILQTQWLFDVNSCVPNLTLPFSLSSNAAVGPWRRVEEISVLEEGKARSLVNTQGMAKVHSKPSRSDREDIKVKKEKRNCLENWGKLARESLSLSFKDRKLHDLVAREFSTIGMLHQTSCRRVLDKAKPRTIQRPEQHHMLMWQFHSIWVPPKRMILFTFPNVLNNLDAWRGDMISQKLLCCTISKAAIWALPCCTCHTGISRLKQKIGLGLPSNGWHYIVPAPSRGNNKSDKRVSMWRWLKINPIWNSNFPIL